MPNLEEFATICWIVYLTQMLFMITVWIYTLMTQPEPELKYRYS
jgi:hypothetical protein